MNKWVSVKDGLPNKDGKYLCYIDWKFTKMIKVCSFALNLKSVDEYDFYDKKGCGWYDYDSEWGYGEVEDITYWMPLPEPPVE